MAPSLRWHRMAALLLCGHLLWPAAVAAQPPASAARVPLPDVLPLRDRPAVVDRWLARRLEEVLPAVMRREGFDMWIVDNREYNEDPVFFSLMPGVTMAARRRTILVFYDPGPGHPLERLAVSRYDIGTFYAAAWDPDADDDPYVALARIVRERDPRRIGINLSDDFAFGDGLTATSHEHIRRALGPVYAPRLAGAERVAIGWLETRIDEEMVVYDHLAALTHRLIARGYSREVIQPGITTTQDVVWWFREAIAERHLETWFQPSVSIIRRRGAWPDAPAGVIMPGDVLHCDVGITYLGLNSDVQQVAYVLAPGEEDVPAGLKRALAQSNRVQDILISEFVTGRTGNEILYSTLARMRTQGIRGSVYTHPIGYHGHGAGPTIGLWDRQQGVPGKGEYPLFPHTVYAIELNARTTIPEWDEQEISLGLEQEAYFDGQRVRWLDRRQTAFHLIG